MRMLLIAGFVIAAPLAAAPAKFEPPPANCPRAAAVHAFDRGKALKPRKLNELPPANQYAAVYRRIGGCEVPLVVRYRVGG